MKKLLLILLCLPFIGFGQCTSEDCLNGQGIYVFPDGKKYEGEYQKGYQHGHGIYTWPDGGNYVGEFKDGQFNGKGTQTWAQG